MHARSGDAYVQLLCICARASANGPSPGASTAQCCSHSLPAAASSVICQHPRLQLVKVAKRARCRLRAGRAVRLRQQAEGASMASYLVSCKLHHLKDNPG